MLASYEELLGEGPELSVLRLVGLFAHAVKREVIASLLQPPAIADLTDTFVDQNLSNESEWHVCDALVCWTDKQPIDGQAID